VKVKEFIYCALAAVMLFAATFAVLWWATSPEVWNVGEHISGCDMSEDCGCYEALTYGK
jgi:hypothetical protein